MGSQGQNISNPAGFSVAAFCGAHKGSSPEFVEAARSLATALHRQGWSLVYGGGTVGMMGEVSKTLVGLSGPQAVHGIIPKQLLGVERKRNPCSSDEDAREQAYGTLTIVDDMHTRKRMMIELADAFVALPGGFGTMEEVLETTTWNILGMHAKPIIFLNVGGYYDDIFQWIRKAIDHGFVEARNADIIAEAKTAEEVIQAIKDHRVAESRHESGVRS
ncbi:hypothetical protein NKR23_g6179 [Pleurostoma richardsiae]|uniref:Cytokinin riboside 5'-monophosphate phosphoribohydrolase n=1 Tax=Pleurostoma richardsiae TaxID=41990 RepID=A0AA38RQH1_9PEZI|nr:hypothetical protein NKR23_g6179 [Pleurostoma richardsiae]